MHFNAGRSVACAAAIASSLTTHHVLASRQAAPRSVLVTIDFRAGAGGVPITDLRPDEVVLLLDGVVHEIRALDLVRLDGGATRRPFATNASADRRRDFILAIDEESFPPGGESVLRDALTAVVGQLSARDRAGLISLHPDGPSVPLGSQQALVQAAIPRVRGRAIGPESSTDLSCRTRRVLPAISSLIRGLDAGITTTVVLFSAALAAPGPAAVPGRGAESACLLLPTDFEEFRAVTTRSAAMFHAMHLADAAPRSSEAGGAAGLERLAGEAGGRFVKLTGDATAEMRSIVAGSSVFYSVTAVVPPAQNRPKRSAEVRIQRDGVTVRLRPELVLPSVETKTVSARDMLRSPNAFRDLALRSAAFASRGTGRQVKMIVLFEPVEPSASIASAMVGAFDARGRLTAEWNSARDDLAGRPAAAALVLDPGVYRLRVAAVDSLGRSGAVDDELRVELAATGGITTSALVTGVPAASGFSPRLQFSGADAAAAVYVEVYGVPTCSAVSAAFDLRATEAGAPLVSATSSAVPIEQSDGCIFYAELGLGSLPSADYLVRFELKMNGAAVGEQFRAIRKAT